MKAEIVAPVQKGVFKSDAGESSPLTLLFTPGRNHGRFKDHRINRGGLMQSKATNASRGVMPSGLAPRIRAFSGRHILGGKARLPDIPLQIALFGDTSPAGRIDYAVSSSSSSFSLNGPGSGFKLTKGPRSSPGFSLEHPSRNSRQSRHVYCGTEAG